MMMNNEQKTLARHALGLPNPQRRSYRNRFVCPEADPEWNAMVRGGLATMRKGETLPFDGDACFYLTRAGAEAALEPREKLCPEDFPVIKTRPILFSAPMIRALVDGSKFQTRRMLKKQPQLTSDGLIECGNQLYSQRPDSMKRLIKDHVPFAIGDRLWVRETWQKSGIGWNNNLQAGNLHYRADTDHGWQDYWGNWKPSIFMPRWISRLTLTVTDVRVQRLQDISGKDAIAEGIEKSTLIAGQAWLNYDKSKYATHGWTCPTNSFRTLWNSINGADAWDQNPWVTALTFTVEKRNIDQVPA